MITIKKIFILPIIGYRYFISPLIGSNCRFEPKCSSYAIEAIQIHGVFKGCFLSLVRISRCHPFGKAGLDPVPCSKKNIKKGPNNA